MEFFLYVTHLTNKEQALQVWGQRDTEMANIVQGHLEQYIYNFKSTLPPNFNDLQLYTRCVAFNSDGKFYRAQVIGKNENVISLQSLDFGFNFLCALRNLRIPASDERLMKIPDQAEGIFFFGIGMGSQPLDILKNDIINTFLRVHVVSNVGGKIVAKMFKENCDIGQSWLQKGLVVSAMTEELFPPPKPPGITYKPFSPIERNVSATPLPNLPPPRQQLEQYSYELVSAEAAYSVIVSDIDEGPWSFSIQLRTDSPLLVKVEAELARFQLTPLKTPVVLGRPCIAFSEIKQKHCRGLIVEVLRNGARVSLVDYGGIEKLSLRHLYQPQPSMFRTKVLAHKFGLSQISKMTVDKEESLLICKAFKDIVSNEILRLQVTAPEDNCMQNCNLFLDTKNVKLLLNQAMRRHRTFSMQPAPKPNCNVPVFVTHVDSVKRFFVQLKENEEMINNLSDQLTNASDSAPVIHEQDFRPGLPCLAQFPEDMQWYRAKIRLMSENSMIIFFVDYGNEISVPLNCELKELRPELIKNPPMQALCCQLANASETDSDLLQNLQNTLNDLSVTMTVITLDKEVLTVNIFYNGKELATMSSASSSPDYSDLSKKSPEFNSYRPQKSSIDFSSDRQQTETSPEFLPKEDSFANFRRPNRNASPSRSNRDRPYSRNKENFNYKSKDVESDTRSEHSTSSQTAYKPRRFQSGSGGSNSKNYRSNEGLDTESFGNSEKGRNKFERNDSRPPPPRRFPVPNGERVQSGSEYSNPSIQPDETINGEITFFVNPNSFYVHLQGNKEEFLQLMSDIQHEYSNKFSVRDSDPLQVGDIVIAEFSEDRVLYRAEVITEEPLTVRFVDYGNFEVITRRRNIYPMMQRLLNIPRQALHCSTYLKPVGDTWAPEASEPFEDEQLTFQFLYEENNVWQVAVTTKEGKDLAVHLVDKGLAVYPSSAQEENFTEISTENIPKINYDLLPGQTLLADIPFISCCESFYVQFYPEAVNWMTPLLAKACADANKLDESNITPGTVCIAAVSEEEFYRVRVESLTDTGVYVHILDFGDSDEFTCQQLYEISNDLSCIPNLAIECSLFGNVTTELDDPENSFKTDYEGGQLIVHVHEINQTSDKISLQVSVYDASRKKLKVQEKVSDLLEYCSLPQLPLISCSMNLQILDFCDNTSVLVQLPYYVEPFIEEPPPGDVVDGEPCTVLCGDGIWRRAIIDGDLAFFVDTGLKEVVSEIRPLPESLQFLPCGVRRVTTNYPMLGPVSASVQMKDGDFLIEPHVKTGFISHVETATHFYFTPESVANRLDEIQLAISETVPEETEENIVAARFPEDNQWYRAKVLSRDPLRVQFLDYGNETEVTEIGKLSPDLVKVPPLAVSIVLAIDLPSTAKEKIEELVAAAEEPLTLIEIDGRPVDLHLSGRSVISQAFGLPLLIPGSIVSVSNLVSSSEVYLQRDEDAHIIGEINERLINESLPVLDEPPTDGLFAAQFEDLWYRAKVVDDQVYFVDFGNSSDLGEVRALPQDLTTIPPLALCVSLMPVEGTTDSLQLRPGGPLLYDALDENYRVLEVKSAEGLISVKLAEINSQESNIPGPSRPPRDTRDQTDDDKSASMVSNETDEEKHGKMQALLNVPDSDLELAAHLDDDVPHLEFELPDTDPPQLLGLLADQSTGVLSDEALAHIEATESVSIPFMSPQGQSLPDEDLLASTELPGESTSLSDEALLQREDAPLANEVTGQIVEEYISNASEENVAGQIVEEYICNASEENVAGQIVEEFISSASEENANYENDPPPVGVETPFQDMTDDVRDTDELVPVTVDTNSLEVNTFMENSTENVLENGVDTEITMSSKDNLDETALVENADECTLAASTENEDSLTTSNSNMKENNDLKKDENNIKGKISSVSEEADSEYQDCLNESDARSTVNNKDGAQVNHYEQERLESSAVDDEKSEPDTSHDTPTSFKIKKEALMETNVLPVDVSDGDVIVESNGESKDKLEDSTISEAISNNVVNDENEPASKKKNNDSFKVKVTEESQIELTHEKDIKMPILSLGSNGVESNAEKLTNKTLTLQSDDNNEDIAEFIQPCKIVVNKNNTVSDSTELNRNQPENEEQNGNI